MLSRFYVVMLPTLHNSKSIALWRLNFDQKQIMLQSKIHLQVKVFIFKGAEEYSIIFTGSREKNKVGIAAYNLKV